MIQTTIAHHLDTHLLSLRDGLKRYMAYAAPRRMHKVRVDMKNIRAVFFLLEDGPHGKKAHRTHREVKRVFAAAGKVREYQLDIAWFRLHRKTMLLRTMKRIPQLKKANALFLTSIPGSVRALKKAGQTGRSLLKKTSEGDIFRYFQSLLNAVLSALQPPWPEAHWHDLRKHAKKLLIAGQWLAEGKPPSASVHVFLADLDLLQKAIGNWHDLILLDQAIREIRATAVQNAIAQKESAQATRILAAEISARALKVRNVLSVMRKRWILGTP
jgi:CHAD domain-containing protein